MKKHIFSRTRYVSALGFSLAFGTLATGASTPSYDVSWFSIDGGAGTCSGGQFSMSGIIGQPDAGTMSGGNFTLDGGFWSMVAVVETPGVRLTLTRSGPNVILSWPSSATGFVLQENGDLGTTNWTSIAQAPSDDGTTKSVTLPAGGGKKFFRLKK